MNRISRMVATTVLAACALAATPATATTITFDDGVAGAPIGAFYAAQGVIFTDGSFTDNFGLVGSSGPLGLASTSREFRPTAANPIIGTFTSLMSSVSIRGVDVGQNGIRFEVYDAANTLLGFQEAFGPDVGVGFFYDVSVSAANIASFRVFQPLDVASDGVLFENLSFEAGDTAVPEPATWALMMLGFGGMGYAMRRRPTMSARIRFA